MRNLASTALLALTALAVPLTATSASPVLPQGRGYETPEPWRRPVRPFRIAERTWYIGTEGLAALLVKTPAGAVVVDGGLPQAADMLLDNLATLGVAPEQVRYIVHSHAHGDHAGALAALKHATGATLVSNAESAALLARGGSDDIHYGDGILFPAAQADRLVQDGEALELGGTTFTVRFTPAHTPGSMSWTWNDRRDGTPVHIAYADSLSAPDYRLLDNPRYPRIVEDYRRGFAAVRSLPCDLLIAPHPGGVGWNPADSDAPHPSPTSCDDYADQAEQALERQLAGQRGRP